MRKLLIGVTVLGVALFPASSAPAEGNGPLPVEGQAQIAAVLGIASSVLSIANEVKSLFGSNNNNNDEAFQHEVIDRLTRIDAQLSTIQNKLDAINARFDELRIHIDAQFEHQRVVDVLAVMRSVDQHYATWIDPNYKPSSTDTVPTPSSVLNDLRRTVAAVREYPSYANFSTVALGMAYEHLLLVNVFHERPALSPDSQRGFGQYAAFFKDAASVDPARTGTVGQSWVLADGALKQVDAQYVALPKPLFCSTGQHLCVPSNPNDWNWYWNVVRATEFSGDPLAGFKPVSISPSVEHDCAGVFVDGPGEGPKEYARITRLSSQDSDIAPNSHLVNL